MFVRFRAKLILYHRRARLWRVREYRGLLRVPLPFPVTLASFYATALRGPPDVLWVTSRQAQSYVFLPTESRMRPKIHAIPILIASFAAGCNLTPEYLRPDVPVPPTFTIASAAPLPNIDADWWRIFRSGTLTTLIAEANVDNTDIAAAFRRIEQARASYKIARSTLFPAIEAGGDATIQRVNAKGFPPDTRKIYDANANLNYEVDLFGGNRAATASARADVVSRLFDREDVELAVQAEVATTYISLLLARERLRISNDTIGNVTEVLRVVVAQFEAGAATSLDTAQQKSALASTRAVQAHFPKRCEMQRTPSQSCSAMPRAHCT